MLRSSQELVRRRERTGTVISLSVKMMLFLIITLGQVFTQANRPDALFIFLIMLPFNILVAVLLFLALRTRYFTLAGYGSVVIDIVIIWVLPFVWYGMVGGEAVPRTYLLKTSVAGFIPMFLIMNSLGLKPQYPLILGLATAPLFIVLYFYASADPRFAVTGDYYQGLMGPAVHDSLNFANFTGTITMAVLLFIITRQARRLVFQSVQNELQSSQLSRYFSPGVVKKITSSDEGFFQPGGKKETVTVMFTDIRDFTTLCERHGTDEVLGLLSEYHGLMVNAIFEYGGTLDKFIGDGLMATFGTPDPLPDAPERAVRAALRMRELLAGLNADREARGLFTIRHGVGIHTGEAIAGNIGVQNRLEYTVIGDTVNTASRIEGCCKDTGRDILVSSAVKESLPPAYRLEAAGRRKLKGREEEVELFAVV